MFVAAGSCFFLRANLDLRRAGRGFFCKKGTLYRTGEVWPCCKPSCLVRPWHDTGLTRRDAAAAKWFFRKPPAQPRKVNPRTITVDKNPAYPKAVTEMKVYGEMWRRSRLR
jgi:DDE domain